MELLNCPTCNSKPTLYKDPVKLSHRYLICCEHEVESYNSDIEYIKRRWNSYVEDYIDKNKGETMKEEKAKRYNTGKIEFDDLPLFGLLYVSKVSRYGESKYGKNNWKKGGPASQYFNCAMRHLLKWWFGEDNDSESKCSHLGHAAWNILALIHLKFTGKLDDDRYKSDVLDMDEIFKVEE